MLGGTIGAGKSNSLMSEFSGRLGEAILRGRMREAEQNARVEAEIATRVKSEFISNMSHELRTPLNTVIGFSRLLVEHEKRQLPVAEVSEYARLIQDAAGHLLNLINDILDISKLQSGRYFLDTQEIAVEEIIEAVISTYARHADQAKVELTSDFQGSLPPTNGDGRKLGQAIANLLSNAIKFTPAGGRVEVSVRPHAGSGSEITITDTGIGMSADEIDIALAPFGQVDGARTRWREGAGLGLSIAKALIELHGGTITIASEKGHGTAVTVFIPSADQLAVIEKREIALSLITR